MNSFDGVNETKYYEILKTLKQIIMSRNNETEIVVTQPDGEVWTYVIKYYENLKNSCVDAFVEDVEYMINDCGPLDEPHYYSNPGGWAMFTDKGNDIIDCDDENLVTFNNDGVGVYCFITEAIIGDIDGYEWDECEGK
jgi:hypothetical protein